MTKKRQVLVNISLGLVTAVTFRRPQYISGPDRRQETSPHFLLLGHIHPGDFNQEQPPPLPLLPQCTGTNRRQAGGLTRNNESHVSAPKLLTRKVKTCDSGDETTILRSPSLFVKCLAGFVSQAGQQSWVQNNPFRSDERQCELLSSLRHVSGEQSRVCGFIQ